MLVPVTQSQLLAVAKPAPKRTERRPQEGAATGRVKRAIADMLRKQMDDHADGSKRLYACACTAVEHDLTDEQAVDAIRAYHAERPFPKERTDKEILQRVRDAEKTVERGSAGMSLWSAEGCTQLANARRFASCFGDSVRYCDPFGKWLLWDNRRLYTSSS